MTDNYDIIKDFLVPTEIVVEELSPTRTKIFLEPLEQGLLTNKYKKDSVFPTSDMRSAFSRDRIKTRIEKRNQFNFLLNNEREINQVALSYVLNRNEISSWKHYRDLLKPAIELFNSNINTKMLIIGRSMPSSIFHCYVINY